MDFGDILNQWDDLCRQEEAEKKAKARGTNKPRPRLPNAPRLEKTESSKTLVIETQWADSEPEEETELLQVFPILAPLSFRHLLGKGVLVHHAITTEPQVHGINTRKLSFLFWL